MLAGDNKSNERVSLTVSASSNHMSKRDPNRAAGFNYETPESQQEKRDANKVKRHMIKNEVEKHVKEVIWAFNDENSHGKILHYERLSANPNGGN